MASRLTRQTIVLLAVKLVQPGMLRDITEGVCRLSPNLSTRPSLKESISEALLKLREQKLVCLYEGRRYMLTQRGEFYIEETGIKNQIDERRLFLLKETRRSKQEMRSDALDGSLQQ